MPRGVQARLGALWVIGAACLLLVVLSAAASAQSQQPEPTAKLWSEYPLDPTRASEPGSTPARRSSPGAPPAAERQPSTPVRAAEPGDDGSSPLPRVGILAGTGLAVLLAAVLALSVLLPTRRRRKERPVPAAAEPEVKTKSRAKATPEQQSAPKRAAKEPKRRKPLPRERPSSKQAPIPPTMAAATPTQQAVTVNPAEAAAPPVSSPTPAEPREPKTNGRAEVFTARRETPAASKAEAHRANEPHPNGAGRPATTWFTEPYESCEIALWRGYSRAQFYARPAYPEPGDYALEVSPKFRFRGETPKARGSALAAYERLIEQLVRRGWEPSGLGGQWFEQWFRRRLPAGHGLGPMGPAPPAETPSGAPGFQSAARSDFTTRA